MSTAGFDYTSISMFDPGSTMATVRIPIIDNIVMESDEVFTATVSTTDPNVIIINDTATITILDNDGRRYVSHIFKC